MGYFFELFGVLVDLACELSDAHNDRAPEQHLSDHVKDADKMIKVKISLVFLLKHSLLIC